MAATKGVNSYVTLAEAIAYFDNKLDVAAWTDASDAQKEQALVTATRYLETLSWVGQVRSESQVLAFPREGEYFDETRGISVTFTTTVPQRITDAVCELAYHMLNNDGLLDDVGSVKSVSVGSISIDMIKSPGNLPGIVYALIKPLRNSGRTVWRAW
jgi:hypothetical protein